jgi:hypothetical protein
MAIWRSSLGQTAVNVASTVVVAELAAGVLKADNVDERFAEMCDETFTYLDSLATQDDEAYEKPADKPARASGGTKTAPRKTARKGGGGRSFSLSDAQDMVLSFGAFEGVSLIDLAGIAADEADSSYGYGDGERSGVDYLAWLAGSKQKNTYVQPRAAMVADELGISYE